MRLLRSSCALCVAVLITACPSSKPPPADDAGVAGTNTQEDAGTAPGPGPATFSLQYGLPDGRLDTLALVGEEEGRPLIEPTSTLELRSSLALRNYRVRIFDEAERALVSDDAAEETPEGLVYRITLPTPLKTGHRYTLVVDAQTGTSLVDARGREVPDLRAGFQILGDKEKPAPPPAKKKRRR